MDHPSKKRASTVVDHRVDTAYETILDRTVLRTVGAAPWIVAQRNAAPARLSELLKLRPRERNRAVATEPRFKTYALASYLLEAGEAAIPYDPSFALDLVRLARAVTVQVDPRTCGGLLALTDLGAYALAWEANVQRVCGNLVAAIATLSRARRVQERGGGDPDITARMDLLEASLRRDTGQYRSALNLLDRASEDLLSLGENDLWTKAQINRSNVFQVQEKFDQAAGILEELLERTSRPDLLLCIRHNIAYLLAKSGQPREAAICLNETRDLYSQFSAPLFNSRRLWVEGIVASDLGEDERAGSLLENAGCDFEERGYGMDAALIRNELERVRGRSVGQPPPRS
ncbi:MAG TPA: tetratricopeptide repeat protein [Thermoanaerobaculia bacterium]|nr:tetratricopeptide repeat protein [Thermoanaerobaculia bacterium]